MRHQHNLSLDSKERYAYLLGRSSNLEKATVNFLKFHDAETGSTFLVIAI